jgi:branched-chain amino acid transport system substrate-binding protein
MNTKATKWIASMTALSAVLAACVAPPPAAAPAAAPGAAPAAPAASNEPVLFIVPAELSGAGTAAGTPWRDGLIMAQEEINAAGGILGRQVKFEVYDTATDPSTSKALIAKGLDLKPYAVLGPLYSGSIAVNMVEAERAKVPQVIGGEAAALTTKGNKYLFRTSFSQAISMPKLVTYIKSTGAKSVAVIYVNNDFGKGGRTTAMTEFEKAGITVAADLATEEKQTDFAPDVLKAVESNADVLFAYLNEVESAGLLKELRKQGYKKPIYGETTLLGAQVLKIAGDDANGVQGHVGLSVDAPVPAIQEFGKKFQAKFGYKSDHNGIKGYTGLYLVKEITERNGKFDSQALADGLHCTRITTAQEPGVLMDVMINENGDLDRDSFLAEVQGGKQVIIKVLPPLGGSCGDKK